MKRLDVSRLWIGQRLVQFLVAYVKNCCRKANAMLQLPVCMCYLEPYMSNPKVGHTVREWITD